MTITTSKQHLSNRKLEWGACAFTPTSIFSKRNYEQHTMNNRSGAVCFVLLFFILDRQSPYAASVLPSWPPETFTPLILSCAQHTSRAEDKAHSLFYRLCLGKENAIVESLRNMKCTLQVISLIIISVVFFVVAQNTKAAPINVLYVNSVSNYVYTSRACL